jgi:hypothetical protein
MESIEILMLSHTRYERRNRSYIAPGGHSTGWSSCWPGLELRQEQNNPALAEAAERRRLELVEVLVQHGARIASPFEHILLTWERTADVFLLGHGPDPHHQQAVRSGVPGEGSERATPVRRLQKAHSRLPMPSKPKPIARCVILRPRATLGR